MFSLSFFVVSDLASVTFSPFRPMVPIGLDPNTYDSPFFYTFDDVKELYLISALTQVVSSFVVCLS